MEHCRIAAADAASCSGVKGTDSTDVVAVVFALRYDMPDRRFSMLMFKRSQLYIGFALAALAEILVRTIR